MREMNGSQRGRGAASPSPLTDNFDAITQPTTIPHRARPNEPPHVTIQQTYYAPELTSATLLQESADDYAQYIGDLEHMFGRRKPIEVSVRTLDKNDSRMFSGSTTKLKSKTSTQQRQRSNQSFRHHGVAPSNHRKEYEFVKDRVLEDSPEKTVSISTWRERVAEETSREVEMSVYYVRTDDYFEEMPRGQPQCPDIPEEAYGRQTPWPAQRPEVNRFLYVCYPHFPVNSHLSSLAKARTS